MYRTVDGHRLLAFSAIVAILLLFGCSRNESHYYEELAAAKTYIEFEDILFRYKAWPSPAKVRAALRYYPERPEGWTGRVILHLAETGALQFPDEIKRDCDALNRWIVDNELFLDYEDSDIYRMTIWGHLSKFDHRIPEETLRKAVNFELANAENWPITAERTLEYIAKLGRRHYSASTWWQEHIPADAHPDYTVWR